MRIMVLGSGAREHALAWKLAQGRGVERVYAGPGNAGTGEVAMNLPGVDSMRFDTVRDACRLHRVDCVLVGPEGPLAAGVVDALRADGIAAIGPDRSAARLEASKAFSKAFLVRNGIPTAEAVEFADVVEFTRYIARAAGRRLVVKKSGLAAGKGVLVSSDAGELAVFGSAILEGDRLLVEECLEGWEVSVFGLSDGADHLVLPPCTDFKRARDGDEGPNTGGMGSICPVPPADEAFMARVEREVVGPVYAALSREGLAYPGVLYFGLMVTASGPKVLEFNVRFGDPETQVLMPMIDADLGAVVEAMAGRGLGGLIGAHSGRPWAGPGAALGVVIAGRGYPEQSAKGAPVELAAPPDGALVFHASTGLDASGRVVTGGGRCFTVVGRGADLAEASRRAYAAVPGVRFDGAWHRNDIGARFTGRAGKGAPMTDVLFLIGSESDRTAVEPGLALAAERGLGVELKVLSAHRNLEELTAFLKAGQPGWRVIIAAAGLSAALPGIAASLVRLPVIGVPLVAGELSGIDALLSILQLPKGVPVATMGIGKQGVLNAVLLAERIIGVRGQEIPAGDGPRTTVYPPPPTR